jgi:hypothetical protein
MKNKRTHQVTGTLKVIMRLKSSVNGNPRYLVKVGDVVLYTKPDSELGYSVINFEGKEITAHWGVHYGKPSLTFYRFYK